ncbi:hypothetical protein GCM10022247_05470 [Allokutzneria multivorans]|uniref:Integral membrane protein n=1 Tax=Allokutzneria multivorans TaxID=1142134 RepID=A0ABP7QYX3_9PSEU
MNRNVVTFADVALSSGATRGDSDRPGKALPGQLTADDYWSRLAKYVPIEMISAYVLLKGLIESAYKPGQTALTVALGVLAVLGAATTWLFSRRVLRVVRKSQAVLSVFGFLVWTIATGGVFATMSWYQPWMGTAAVIMFGVAVQIIQLPPLPVQPDRA